MVERGSQIATVLKKREPYIFTTKIGKGKEGFIFHVSIINYAKHMIVKRDYIIAKKSF